eukprot:scaffold6314_cov273-Ochromonas_danica.AAC.40
MVQTEHHLIKIPDNLDDPLSVHPLDDTIFTFPSLPISSAQVLSVWMVTLAGSVILWLGATVKEGGVVDAPTLESLLVAMHSTEMGGMTSTLLARPGGLTDAWDDAGEGLARRLAKRYGIQVFLSDQLPSSYHQSPICHFVEKNVNQLLEKHFPRLDAHLHANTSGVNTSSVSSTSLTVPDEQQQQKQSDLTTITSTSTSATTTAEVTTA